MGYMNTGDPRTYPPDQQTIYSATDVEDRSTRQVPVETKEEKVTTGVFAGGASIEAIGGLAAVVLAIIGFASGAHYVFWMTAASTLVIGFALLVHGGSIVARWRQVQDRLLADRGDRAELVGGIGTEVFGGVVGIVLAILALANVLPYVMLPIAAIVYGGALLLGGAATPELEGLAPERDPRFRRYTKDAIEASGGVMVMVGIAAAVLGILALVSVGPFLTLTLVAMLAMGGALLLAGGSLTARFARHFR